ncbi:MAG: mono/diheme cytochrome c family protein [Candidatus Latescibacterota bacterium]|jgi:mono/diheme cytochrome c family protein
MRLVFKILLGLGVLVFLVVGVGVYVLKTSFPNVGDAPDVQIGATPERIARGRYLAHHVTVCIDCHSTRDWDHFAAPPLVGTEGKGGEVFPEEAGFPGTLIAPNITPAALGNWSDGEVVRAITSGVNKKGDALFPLMPYTVYAQMTQEDVYSVIAYVRTLKPIENTPPRSSLSFPMNWIVRTIPKPYVAPTPPDQSNYVVYGKYLATIGGCGECHTPHDHGTPLPGMHMAGGFEFLLPTGKVTRAANITPDMETGIGHWKRAYFIAQFKRFDKPEALKFPIQGGYNTVMPWTMYAGMTESDLGAIFDYLQTVPPVKNGVDKFPE